MSYMYVDDVVFWICLKHVHVCCAWSPGAVTCPVKDVHASTLYLCLNDLASGLLVCFDIHLLAKASVHRYYVH